MQPITPAWLQSIETLQQVPVHQLQWWIDNSEQYELEEDSYLFKEGEPVKGTYVISKGKVKVFLKQQNGERNIDFFEAKDIAGYLPFSRGIVAAASGQVIEPLEVMYFPKTKMTELINLHFELVQALVHVMTTRVRFFTTMQQQNEKMMALGKLSAGLAHELNNPASAVVRGSTSLKKHLHLQPESFKKVMLIQMTTEQVDEI